jgi:hypothetical protein
MVHHIELCGSRVFTSSGAAAGRYNMAFHELCSQLVTLTATKRVLLLKNHFAAASASLLNVSR